MDGLPQIPSESSQLTGVAFNILFANLATSKKKVFLLPGLMTWHLYFGLV